MTPLPTKELTVTLPRLPSLFSGCTAEEKFKAAVCWAVERHYPEAAFVFVRWDPDAARPQAEVNERAAGPEVDQFLHLVLQLQELWLLALESVRDYLDSQLTLTRRALRLQSAPQRPSALSLSDAHLWEPVIPEYSSCGQVCSESQWRGANHVCEPCWKSMGFTRPGYGQ